MTFQSVAAAPGKNAEDLIVSIPKQATHKPRLRISMHPKVADRLGWEHGAMIEPLHGEGPDRGLIKLRPAKAGGFRLQKAKAPCASQRHFVVFRAPKDAPNYHRSQPAEYTVNPMDHSITIRLPWAEKTVLRAVGT